MKLFDRLKRVVGSSVPETEAPVLETKGAPTALSTVPFSTVSNFFGPIRESFTGAWQRNVVVEQSANILAFSAVYAAISLISNDISKLRIMLTEETAVGTWEELEGNSPFLPVLSKPNRYQTRQQFIQQWIVAKLMYGNAYVLKERDQRGIVIALYVLDSRYVQPLVAEDGSVYYRLHRDYLSGVIDEIIIPATEIMHDRMPTLWHPLVGVSPIYACGASTTQGIRIQNNSAKFFENMSRPSGHLTAPGVINDVTVNRLKAEFEKNFSGGNLGRLLVTGDALKYEPMTIPPHEAQLIEQLKWTVEDVARAFLIPLYKIETSSTGRSPASNLAQLNQDYYDQTLQVHIEAIEALLDEGLALPGTYATQLDLDGLLRMDPLAQAETFSKEIQAGYLAPNEARARRGLRPATGGDTPYLQQQNYSLAALAKRDALADPFAKTSPAPASTPDTTPTPPAPASGAPPAEGKEFREFMDKMEAFEMETLAAEIRRGLSTE